MKRIEAKENISFVNSIVCSNNFSFIFGKKWVLTLDNKTKIQRVNFDILKDAAVNEYETFI